MIHHSFFLILIISILIVGSGSATLNAAITANSTCHIGVPVPVQFSGYCEGEGVTNIWDFGDGDTSDEQTLVHVYETYGMFTISHVCSDEAETVFDETYITITNEGKCPDATCTVEDGCVVSQSSEVLYDNESTGISIEDIGYSARTKNRNTVKTSSLNSQVNSGIESASESTMLNEQVESSGIEAGVTNGIPAKAPVASESKGLNILDYVMGGGVVLVIGAVLLLRRVP